MTTTNVNLLHGTVGELRQILNRQDIRDDARVTMTQTVFVGEDYPHHDGTGHDEIRSGVRQVTVIERPGTVQPQIVRLT